MQPFFFQFVNRASYLAACVALFALQSASAAQEGGVKIGKDADASHEMSVAIGHHAKATGHPQIAGGASQETVAVGHGAWAEGWRCTAVGAGAHASVVSATAIGRGAYAHGAHMIAIGRGAFMEKIDGSPDLHVQNACGIAGDSLWLGGNMSHKYIDRTGDTYVHMKIDGGDDQKRWNVQTSKPRTYTIHGMDAYDARFDQAPERFNAALYEPDDPATWVHRVDRDVQGGSLIIAAGRGTGTAKGGDIEIQTAPKGKVSRNRKNPLRTGLKIDTNYHMPDATPMLLWDNNSKTLKRVYVGPADSGGKGYRALVIEN